MILLFYKIKKYFSGNKRSTIVKKNIVGSLFLRIISIITSFLLVPITIGYVSPELYGIWLTLSSIITWLGFFDIGFTLGLKNKLTEAIANNDWEKGKALVSTTYFMMVVIFLPLCILIELFIPIVDWCDILNINSIYKEDILACMHVIIAFFGIQMIVSIITSVLAAFQKVAISSSFAVIGNVISLFVVILLTKFCPPSLFVLALSVSSLPLIVMAIASFYYYSGSIKKVAPHIKYVQKQLIGDLFGLGYKFFIIQIHAVVLYQTTNMLISNISGPYDVANYNIVYRYLNVAVMAFSTIFSPLWPAFTDAYVQNDYDWMKRINRKMTRFFGLSVMIIILMLCVSPFVYKIWIGDVVSIPLSLTFTLTLYTIIHNWSTYQGTLVVGIGAVKLESYFVLVGLFLHVPLSLLLGKTIGFGLYGVIFSMTFINAIYAVLFTIQVNKILNHKASGIWLE